MKTHNFRLAACDTDSISFSKKDGSPFSDKERKKILSEINGLMRDGIEWADDGVFKKLVVVAAKNYIMESVDDKGKLKVKIKGSGLKATKKEPRLKQFTLDIIDLILKEDLKSLPKLYTKYAKEIMAISEISDINQWGFKVTVTKKVMEPGTSFNKKVFKALARNKVEMVEGDKHYMFFLPVTKYKTKEVKYKTKKGVDKVRIHKTPIQRLEMCQAFNGQICKKTLLKKLFVTIKIFRLLIDIKAVPNLTLKKNLQAMEAMIPLKGRK